MPILVDEQGQRYTESDAKNIYNALKSGKYKLENGSSLAVRDDVGNAFVLDPKGDVNQQFTGAIESGARLETAKETFERLNPEFTGLSGSLIAAGTSAVNTALLGAPEVIATMINENSKERFDYLKEEHPYATLGGEIAAFIPKISPAGLVASGVGAATGGIAKGAIRGVSEAAAVSKAGKLGISAAEGAGIGAASAIPTAVTEGALGDPTRAAENFMSHIGTGALIGGLAAPLVNLLGIGSKAILQKTDLTKGDMGVLDTQKKWLADRIKTEQAMTSKQAEIWDNLVKDPELREAAKKATADADKDAIVDFVETLKDTHKVLNKEVKQYYGKEFDSITQAVSAKAAKEGRLQAYKILDEAEAAVRKNPESYNPSLLKQFEAARKTLSIKGAQNRDIGEALKRVLSEGDEASRDIARTAYEQARVKSLKEARTQLRYKKGLGESTMGSDQTANLAQKVYDDLTQVTNSVYGDKFVQLSDMYHTAKTSLKELMETYATKKGEPLLTRGKAGISFDPAKEAKLDAMIQSVESLQKALGTSSDLGNRLSEVTKVAKARRVLNMKSSPEEAPILGQLVNQVPVVGKGANYVKEMFHNPRQALKAMELIESAQAKTSNIINAISRGIKTEVPASTTIAQTLSLAMNDRATGTAAAKQYYDAMSNPDTVRKQLEGEFGQLSKLAPNVLAETTAKTVQVSQFLSGKAPNVQENPYTGKMEVKDSIQKVKAFEIYEMSASNPMKALSDLNDGKNIQYNREVLQVLYPAIWSEYVQTKMQEMQNTFMSIDKIRYYNDLLGLNDQSFTLPALTNSVLSSQEEAKNPPRGQLRTPEAQSADDRLSRR